MDEESFFLSASASSLLVLSMILIFLLFVLWVKWFYENDENDDGRDGKSDKGKGKANTGNDSVIVIELDWEKGNEYILYETHLLRHIYI